MGGPTHHRRQLRVAGLATTEMGCDPDRHDQDSWLSAFLAAGPAVTLTATISSSPWPGASIELLDREVADARPAARRPNLDR